jgi:hypothetical protein
LYCVQNFLSIKFSENIGTKIKTYFVLFDVFIVIFSFGHRFCLNCSHFSQRLIWFLIICSQIRVNRKQVIYYSMTSTVIRLWFRFGIHWIEFSFSDILSQCYNSVIIIEISIQSHRIEVINEWKDSQTVVIISGPFDSLLIFKTN